MQCRLFDRILDEAAEVQRSVEPWKVRKVALGNVFNKLVETHFEGVPCTGQFLGHTLDGFLSQTEENNNDDTQNHLNRAPKPNTTFRWRGRRGRGKRTQQ